jgi:hypothetical protein
MSIVRSLILVAFGGLLLLMAVRRLRRYQLKERYTLLFLFLGVPFLVLAVWPGGVEWLARLLGMAYYTAMLLCVSAFLILTVFELLTIVSQQDRRISTLAQGVAILMEKQKELEGRMAPKQAAAAEEAPAAEAPRPEALVEARGEPVRAPRPLVERSVRR